MANRKTGRKQALAKPTSLPVAMDYESLVAAIARAHDDAQWQAVQAVNLTLTLRNWLVGYYIVEYEQHGADHARYGKQLLSNLAKDLRKRLGRGFGQRNLFLFREFYLRYPILQSVIAKLGINLPAPRSVAFTPLDWQDDAYFVRLFRELSWTHFIELIRIDDPLKRAFYEIESLRNRWSVREFKRQLNSLLYERVGLSRDKEGVLELAKEGERWKSAERFSPSTCASGTGCRRTSTSPDLRASRRATSARRSSRRSLMRCTSASMPSASSRLKTSRRR